MIVHIECRPSAVAGLHAQQPLDGALDGGFPRAAQRASPRMERQKHHGGVVDVRIELVGKLEIPARRLGIGPLDRPIALPPDLLGQEPVGAPPQRLRRGHPRLRQRKPGDRRVPDHREAGLKEEPLAVVNQEPLELAHGLDKIRVVLRVAKHVQRHDHVHHGRVNPA